MSRRSRHVRSRWWVLAAVLPLTLGVAVAPTAGADGRATLQPVCGEAEREAFLRQEQRAVLNLVAEYRVLESSEDLQGLGTPDPAAQTAYNFLDHRFASAFRMGIGIVDTWEPVEGGAVEPGRPDVLFYAPDPDAENVVDPEGPDFPYTLVGWAYTPGTYHYATLPELPCMGRADWFVHERSVHPYDTWQNVPAPPLPPLEEEDWQGQTDNAQPIPPTACVVDGRRTLCPPGIHHPRIWDIHFWLGTGGRATVSLLRPRRPIPGWDPDIGVSFFHPPLQVPEAGND